MTLLITPGVGKNPKGVIFLFFSRFKPWRRKKRNLTEGYYIFGWLEVDHTVKPDETPHPLDYHPHFLPHHRKDKNNIIYVAAKKITDTDLSGAGMFNRLSNSVRLSYYAKSNLLTFKLPRSAYDAFSRIKNYQELDGIYCTGEWPQSFGQEAVFPRINTKFSKEKIKKKREWAITIITNGIKNGEGIKEGYL